MQVSRKDTIGKEKLMVREGGKTVAGVKSLRRGGVVGSRVEAGGVVGSRVEAERSPDTRVWTVCPLLQEENWNV